MGRGARGWKASVFVEKERLGYLVVERSFIPKAGNVFRNEEMLGWLEGLRGGRMPDVACRRPKVYINCQRFLGLRPDKWLCKEPNSNTVSELFPRC